MHMSKSIDVSLFWKVVRGFSSEMIFRGSLLIFLLNNGICVKRVPDYME